MTTALCFDLDGTLLRLDRPYDELLAEAFEAELGTSDEAMIEAYEAAFVAAFKRCDPDPVGTAMAAALEAGDREDAELDALVEARLAAEQRHTSVPPGTRESLDALGADHDLAVITNGPTEWQRAKLDHHDLTGHFETVVTSAGVGAHMPDPAPFEAAKERLDAEEFVMVGDDYEADVEGARAAGFIPVHVEDSEGTPDFWATLRAMI